MSRGACPWNQVLLNLFLSFAVVLNLQQPATLYTFASIHPTEPDISVLRYLLFLKSLAQREAPGASSRAAAHATRATTTAQGKLTGRLTDVGNLILEASRFRN